MSPQVAHAGVVGWQDVPVTDELIPDGLVWHYTDGGGLLSILSNHVLWATASGYLNDSQEVNLGYGLIMAELERRVRTAGAERDWLTEWLAESRLTRRGPSPSQFFILSAAQHWDLLAMWRCYGGMGESYAIGLDPGAALKVLVDPGAQASEGLVRQRRWRPVAYAREQQEHLIAAVFDGLPEEIEQAQRLIAAGQGDREGVMQIFSQTFDDIEQALALIKHEGFHDEREIRFTTALMHRNGLEGWPGVVRFRTSRYGIAPYLWLTGDDGSEGHLVTRPAPLPIRAVVISPSPNGEAAEESLTSLLAARGYPVPVVRSAIPFRA